MPRLLPKKATVILTGIQIPSSQPTKGQIRRGSPHQCNPLHRVITVCHGPGYAPLIASQSRGSNPAASGA